TKESAEAALLAAERNLRRAQDECRRLEEAWQKKKERISNEIAAGRSRIDERQRLINEINEKLSKLEQNMSFATDKVKEAVAKHGDLLAERRSCGIEGSPDTCLAKLQKANDDAADAAADAKTDLATAQNDLENGKAEKANAEEEAAKCRTDAAKDAAEFLERCRERGFADETDWQEACWEEGEIDRVERDKRKLDEDKAALKVRKGDLSVWLEEFSQKTPSARQRDVVEAELAAKTRECEEIKAAIQQLIGELNADGQQRAKADAIARDLEGLRAEEKRWNTLDKELGGEGGANFKLYAQGVTLSNLIEIGNEYLAPMTNGRYVMVWDADGPDAEQLLPTIVDRRSGGERRPVTNLSGGERFQVSLALALGLSRLNAGTLNVETLFLDEGFGTLDEKTLDVSISTLENLQRDGAKTIGIISHVKELEDRITTQIQARKTGNGVSVLSGAGVSQLSL
ncbi:MAG: hypothetical protein IKO55_05085, partial [Kiritimatiellae bacterium]|nr:hypothetical protein [Kiritimatiellia bacterium]